MSDSMSKDELREKVLQAVYDISNGIPGKRVELRRVAQVVDLDPDNPDDARELYQCGAVPGWT
jgi:predicted transcriptional regulator with HTH domain